MASSRKIFHAFAFDISISSHFILHFQSKVPKLIYAVESNIWDWKWRNGARLAILQARNKGERKLGSPNEAIVIFNWVSIFIHVVCRIWHNIMV